MAAFWRWSVRYPAWLLGAGSIALAARGAVDPELGFTGAFVFALLAYAAGYLARAAERRAERRALGAMPPRLTVIPGLKAQREAPARKAA